MFEKLGPRLADKITETLGSWSFIIIQTFILITWLILNIVGWMKHWDPYPFILLNLFLSFQAAYTGPIVLMSQNREAQRDREAAQNDYDVNKRAELEIKNVLGSIHHLRVMVEHLTQKVEGLEHAKKSNGNQQHRRRRNKSRRLTNRS